MRAEIRLIGEALAAGGYTTSKGVDARVGDDLEATYA
jgi:hypothetical protein